MATLQSQEEIDAVTKALEPYFNALGRVAHEWNHLHEELGKVFCAVANLDLSVGMAIWHSLKSDRSQRDILKGAIESASNDEDWTTEHPGAVTGVQYLVNKTNALADKRNAAIHAPCHVLPGPNNFEIRPITFFGNEKAKRLHSKDILEEFAWYEGTARALRRHACDVCFALHARIPWPEKPALPALGQKTFS
jgi:hypothetical protein